MIQASKKVHERGACEVSDVYHGTYGVFDEFSGHYLSSVGFHFGDLEQANYFATNRGEGGRIIKAALTFKNLVNIGEDDWGWIDCKRGAFLCFLKFQQSNLSLDRAAFERTLGPKGWNLADYTATEKMSSDERGAFADLLRAHDFDGIQYTNNYEPPGKVGQTAYFVLNADQIRIQSVVKIPTGGFSLVKLHTLFASRRRAFRGEL